MTEMETTAVLLQLADHGITGILISYSGGGGDNQIDDIVYTKNKLSEDENRAINEIDSIDAYTPTAFHLQDIDIDTKDALEDFVMSILLYSKDIPNWWKNDGGYGAVSILVPSGKYRIVNTIYITDSDTSIHSGNLLNKTEEI
jgi:hypothetical protein